MRIDLPAESPEPRQLTGHTARCARQRPAIYILSGLTDLTSD